MGSGDQKLRFLNYLTPGFPLELIQVYQHYLEQALGVDSVLMVESRWSGPPPHKLDPFTADEADIVFMCSSMFLRLLNEKNKFMEHLPAAPIHIHPFSDLQPVYFADVIVHGSKREKYTSFKDLKGHTWAYNEELSLSGNYILLKELKKMGADASFLGTKMKSGSHLNSIKMVANYTADAASVDSTVLKLFLEERPELKKDIHVLCSWGPLPIQPIVLNARLPNGVKEKLREALLAMNKIPEWNQKLAKFSVWGFKPCDISIYDKEEEIKEIIGSTKLQTIYY